MKKLFILALLPFTVSAQQQYNKPVMCAQTQHVINTLTGKEYEEKPVWMGVNAQDNTFSLFINRSTKGWTLIEFRGNTACVLGAGDESQISRDFSNN